MTSHNILVMQYILTVNDNTYNIVTSRFSPYCFLSSGYDIKIPLNEIMFTFSSIYKLLLLFLLVIFYFLFFLNNSVFLAHLWKNVSDVYCI